MFLFSKQSKFLCLSTVAFLLAACNSAVTPVDQIQQSQKNAGKSGKNLKQVEKGKTLTLYGCKNDKKVEVERQKASKKSNKKETVTVTFQGTSHQLSSVVTKDGKKYTNIRWTWHETRSGKAYLYNNSKKTLATDCVKR